MKLFPILSFLLLSSLNIFAQHYTISGYVEDAQSGERIIGCYVRDADNPKYITTTNEFGYFSLKTNKKNITLNVSFIGYAPFNQKLQLKSDTSLIIKLQSSNEIGQVVITAEKQNVQSSQMSTIDVPLTMMKTLPVIFGEVDLFKTLQLMPGVASGTEGTSGIHVRGGGPDQNLILLDGVPVYNASHLFGFFSVFNSEAIKSVKLYKGGFPARYGGRLSSVIDVRIKDGNMHKLKSSVSVGLISSKFTIEGPIKENKTSFIISARRTYADAILAPFIKLFGKSSYSDSNYSYTSNFGGGYYFYDLNAKLTHNFSEKDRIFVSFYAGHDKAHFNFREKGKYDNINYNDNSEMFLKWGNSIASARWNHSFAKNMFLNTTLTYSRFNFAFGSTYNYEETADTSKYTENYLAQYSSGIDDIALSSELNFIPNINHKIRIGITGIYHTFRPGEIHFAYNESQSKINFDTTFGNAALYASEFALFGEDDFKISSRLKVNYGVRLSAFKVRDTIFLSPEPRISARFLVNDNFSIKASYAQMKQYLHFLTNNTVGMPIDLWMPATDLIVPEKSWQTALGISWLIKNKFSLQTEAYYKKMNNLIEFKEGESIFSMQGGKANDESWETKVTQGNGTAYGAEIYLKKNTGKLTGWISYTLSWSYRTFADINFGKTFPYKYDKRHDISIVMSYAPNKNFNLGMTWIFSSGTPVTLQTAEYAPLSPQVTGLYNNTVLYEGIQYYGNRNNYRLPPYHRLDLSANFIKQKKHGIRTWSVGVYNVYNHINPFYTQIETTFDAEGNRDEEVLAIYSIFQIMPFVSYKFEW